MGASTLSSRAIIGEFYNRLETSPLQWAEDVSMYMESDQASEEYRFLGMTAQLREWVGGRQAKALREQGFVIRNKVFEGTLEVSIDDLRRDKTSQIMTRVAELAVRANSHKGKLLSDLILAAEATVCYDGQYFFDTDHSEFDSGSQSNDITNDIGTTTAPTAAEMESSILKAIAQMLGFKDDQGEPMNEEARDFLVVIPPSYMAAALSAVTTPLIADGTGARTALIPNLNGYRVQVQVNPRLTSWTTKLAVFRTDGVTKPFIFQEEVAPTISAVAEGSEMEKIQRKHLYMVDAIRNAGYGMWQHACLVTHV